jgi:hypothetical protein
MIRLRGDILQTFYELRMNFSQIYFKISSIVLQTSFILLVNFL